MTGELCDCYETKRQGVEAIIAAVRFASDDRPIRVWSSDGVFVDAEQAKRNYLKVAAANWHALATLAGQYVPNGRAILVDVGSTTTDIIPILDGVPVPSCKTDDERLTSGELIYTGVRRTPLCALMGWSGAAELFATALDVYVLLGLIPENSADCDTADGRPATKDCARVRLSRMYCGDVDTVSQERIENLANRFYCMQLDRIRECRELIRRRLKSMHPSDCEAPWDSAAKKRKKGITYITAGSGEFLAHKAIEDDGASAGEISLSDQLGPTVSVCAPAYAVAVFAQRDNVARQQLPARALALERSLVIVVKLGGSLFDHPQLGPGLHTYLQALAPEPVLLVPGGGALINSLRRYDRLHGLGQEVSHWLALQAMSVTAGVIARLIDLPAFGLRVQIPDCLAFLRDDDCRPGSLPHSWHVTSDSIAARIATVHNAYRLILLKSIDIPPGTSWREAAARGWVDGYFPEVVASARFTVEMVNFARILDMSMK